MKGRPDVCTRPAGRPGRGWCLPLLAFAICLVACRLAVRQTPPAPTATLAPPPRAFADAQLLPWTWEDRSPFRAGLKESEAGILDDLPGASVYHMDIEIAEDALSVSGRAEVRFTNQEAQPLADVVFRLFPNQWGASMTVADVQVNGAAVVPSLENAESVLRIPLSEPLRPGQSVVVSMAYALVLPEDPTGNYGLLGLDDGVLALPHAYPLIPAFDDHGWYVDLAPDYGDVLYADVSFYLMRVHAPADWVLVASGVEVERTEAEGRQTVTYAAGPMRDVYLTASPEFGVVSRQVGDVLINSFASNPDAEARGLILDVAESSLEYFDGWLGPYPYTELDLVETHTSALGIEYPGLVALSSEMYEVGSSGLPREVLQSVVVHEVGHQWFFGLVGNDQVREPWLDESLTQYATLRYYGDVFGEAGRSGFRRSLEERWQRADDEEMPVGLPVEDYSPRDYSAVVYGKGALFFEALEDRMGAGPMDAFLRDYVASYRFSIVDGGDLRAEAELACGSSLQGLFDAWIGPG
jgi:hypothetical protein